MAGTRESPTQSRQAITGSAGGGSYGHHKMDHIKTALARANSVILPVRAPVSDRSRLSSGRSAAVFPIPRRSSDLERAARVKGGAAAERAISLG